MRPGRPKLAVRMMMVMVAATALLLAGPVEMIRYKLRERAIICQRAAEQDEGLLPGIEAKVASLEWRIAKFEQRSPMDSRHERWVKELVYERRLASRVRAEIPAFRRLSSHPWEPIPTNPTFGDLELREDDRKLIDRGSAGRMVSALAIASGAALLAGSLLGHLRARNPGIERRLGHSRSS
jgi:hypothetical protein